MILFAKPKLVSLSTNWTDLKPFMSLIICLTSDTFLLSSLFLGPSEKMIKSESLASRFLSSDWRVSRVWEGLE